MQPEQRAELIEIYRATDALHAAVTCDASTECCRFGITGREPYPTAIEIAELERAIRARGGMPKIAKPSKKRLPIAAEDEQRCPLLSDAGTCIVYASRPFGCRTFFCDRAEGALPSREQIRELSQKIAALSDRFSPGNPGPRPLRRVLSR